MEAPRHEIVPKVESRESAPKTKIISFEHEASFGPPDVGSYELLEVPMNFDLQKEKENFRNYYETLTKRQKEGNNKRGHFYKWLLGQKFVKEIEHEAIDSEENFE